MRGTGFASVGRLQHLVVTGDIDSAVNVYPSDDEAKTA